MAHALNTTVDYLVSGREPEPPELRQFEELLRRARGADVVGESFITTVQPSYTPQIQQLLKENQELKEEVDELKKRLIALKKAAENLDVQNVVTVFTGSPENIKGGIMMKSWKWLIILLGLLPISAQADLPTTKDNGYYKITITAIDTVSIISSDYWTADDGPYAVIEVIMENITIGESLFVNPFNFTIHSIDQEGFAYDDEADFVASIVFFQAGDFPVDDLWPGEKTKGRMAFQVRPNIIEAFLIFSRYPYPKITFILLSQEQTAIISKSWGQIKHRFKEGSR